MILAHLKSLIKLYFLTHTHNEQTFYNEICFDLNQWQSLSYQNMGLNKCELQKSRFRHDYHDHDYFQILYIQKRVTRVAIYTFQLDFNGNPNLHQNIK